MIDNLDLLAQARRHAIALKTPGKPSSTIRILSVDLSIRNTGFAKLEIHSNPSYRLQLHGSGCIKSVAINSNRVGKLKHDSQCAFKLIGRLREINNNFECELIVVEMPDFSQDAKSAIHLGMLWGSLMALQQEVKVIQITPSALKTWSESKRGDGKQKVIEQVLERVWIPPSQQKNNNITDACGIALLYSDLVKEVYDDLETP